MSRMWYRPHDVSHREPRYIPPPPLSSPRSGYRVCNHILYRQYLTDGCPFHSELMPQQASKASQASGNKVDFRYPSGTTCEIFEQATDKSGGFGNAIPI